jgi:hypothetical protein
VSKPSQDEFEPSMSLPAILDLPSVKRRAFALTFSPRIGLEWMPSWLREGILSVNVPEAGQWGVRAQELLLPRQETPEAAKRRVKALKLLLSKNQWTGLGNHELGVLEMEEAADLAAAVGAVSN